MYKTEIGKYYNSNLLESFLSRNNDAYNSAINQKKEFNENWKTIVNFYKSIGYARDVSNASHLQTNSLIIGVDKIREGIILNISFLPKYFGIYFYHQDLIATIPIIDKFGKENTHLSFFPFNRQQEDFSRNVLDYISTYLPDFSVFNNIYANSKISNVIIDGTIPIETNFFQVIFEDNMYTIF